MEGFFTKKEVQASRLSKNRKSSCFRCGLYRKCESPKMEPYGLFGKEILIIKDMPSTLDDDVGSYKDNTLLKKALAMVGVDLYNDCLTIGALACHTEGGRKAKSHEIDCCRDVKVIPLIKQKNTKLIILLGTTSVASIIGYRWKKNLDGILKWRGWTIPDRDFNTWICPTYHPKMVEAFEKPVMKVIFNQDIERAISCLDKPLPKPLQVKIIKKVPNLEDFEGLAAFDYETTGEKPQHKDQKIQVASIAINENEAFVFNKLDGDFKQFLKNKNIKKIAANLKYEDNWSKVKLNTKVNNWYFDTMQAAHILDNRPGITSLKFQAYVNFGIVDYDSHISDYLKPKEKGAAELNRVNELDPKELAQYSGEDSVIELALAKKQIKQIKDRKLSTAYSLFHKGIQAFAKAERQGFRLDVEVAYKQHDMLTDTIEKLDAQIKESKFYRHWDHVTKGHINLDSNKQLSTFLYDIKKLKPVKYTKSGQGATDVEALEALDIPELNMMLESRKLKKLRDTYLGQFFREEVNGFVHMNLNLHLVSTYRSSSDSPNIQNIPNRDKRSKEVIRSCIFARKGHQILELDFKSIEVVIAACYHKDPNMLKYIREKHDMHGDMAKQIFMIKDFDKSHPDHHVLRQAAKNGFVFPQFYGDYFANNALKLAKWTNLRFSGDWEPSDGIEIKGEPLANHLFKNGIKSMNDFMEHLKKIERHFWTKRFPVYNKWRNTWWNAYQQKGWFRMKTGFISSGVMDRNQVINSPVQGAAFHCLLWSFIQLSNYLTKHKFDSKIIFQIHDSIIVDINPDELLQVIEIARQITTIDLPKAFPWIIAPLEVEMELSDVDKSWNEKKEIKI